MGFCVRSSNQPETGACGRSPGKVPGLMRFDDPGELPRILRKIADIVDGDGDNNHGGPVLDMNGNTVGLFQISGKRG